MNSQVLAIEYIIGSPYENEEECLEHFRNKVSDGYFLDSDIDIERITDKVFIARAKMVPNIETK